METSQEKKLIGQVDAAQITAWKEKHKIEKVLSYVVDDRICYFKPVDRNTYSLAASKISISPAKFNETLINNTWLGGDETIKKDDGYFFGLIDNIEGLMNKKKGELGEL